jgi:hypothetical protein
MQMKNTSTLYALSRTACVIVLTSLGVTVSAQTAQFEYDLKITADPAKRVAYLRESGEAPSPYEQVFNLVKGSMQVATVVEKVNISKDRYHINSIGTLGSVLSTVLQDQKLIRDSVGSNGPNGLLTNTYQEKRGNTDLLIAKVDTPKSIINFYKISS